VTCVDSGWSLNENYLVMGKIVKLTKVNKGKCRQGKRTRDAN